MDLDDFSQKINKHWFFQPLINSDTQNSQKPMEKIWRAGSKTSQKLYILVLLWIDDSDLLLGLKDVNRYEFQECVRANM